MDREREDREGWIERRQKDGWIDIREKTEGRMDG